MTVTAAETTDLISMINSMAPVGPSYREIMDMWGLASSGHTKRKLDKLKAQGIIDWKPRCARSIHIRQAKFFIIEKKTAAYDARLIPMEAQYG